MEKSVRDRIKESPGEIHSKATSILKPCPALAAFTSSSSNSNNKQKKQEAKTVKCILVGDSQVGKTALVHTFLFDKKMEKNANYYPTARDDYTFCTTVTNPGGHMDVDLDICDTGGETSLDRLRPLCYSAAEVAIICFSVVIPSSFANVTSKWIPELKRHCLNYKRMKIILVGTQSDLRSNVSILITLMEDGLAPISETRALKYAKKIGAVKYIECSALNKYNIKKVFDLAMTPSPIGSPLLNGPLQPKGPPPPASALNDRKSIFSRRWRLRQKSNKIKRLMFLSCLF